MTSTTQLFIDHFWVSLAGTLSMLVRHPVFGVRLLYIRAAYLFKRRLIKEIRDPYGFRIRSPSILISYWAIIVEPMLRRHHWAKAFRAEHNPVAIDVGANAGVFTHFLGILNPNSHIVAFEPLPRMAARIGHMERSPTLNVTIINAACGAQKGSAELYTRSDDDTAASFVEKLENSSPIKVDVVTLDDALAHLEHIFLLKVDTERYELQVLAGAGNTLKKVRYLLLEILAQDEMDAICKHLGDAWKPLRITHSDVLFSRSPGR